MENQYLLYEEYLNFGGKSEKMPFNILEFKARQIIDRETLGRLQKLNNQNENVKLCMYELIKLLENQQNIEDNKLIASENIDGYSVTYKADISNKTFNEDIQNIIFDYLINCRTEDNIPYLYRGV